MNTRNENDYRGVDCVKNIRKHILFLSLVPFALAGCGTTQNHVDENGYSTEEYEILLNYSDHDPPSGMRTSFIEEYWFPEIEKETNGKVKINAIYGGGLLGSSEALNGVRDGVADMGLIYPDNYPQRMFSYDLLKLFPEGPDNFENMYEIFSKAMVELPRLQEDLNKNNQKPLLITTGLPIVFGSTEKLDSLADLKGGQWRASSRWYLEAIKNIGANPVSVPWDDVYMSLETNVIDGVMTNYDGFHMMKFYETTPNIIVGTRLWWSAPFIHTINQDAWDRLPIDLQEGIMRATETAQVKFGEVYENELQTAIDIQEAAGATVKIADDEDIALFSDDELFERLRATWVKEAKEKHGIEDADQYVEDLERIMKEAIERSQND